MSSRKKPLRAFSAKSSLRKSGSPENLGKRNPGDKSSSLSFNLSGSQVQLSSRSALESPSTGRRSNLSDMPCFPRTYTDERPWTANSFKRFSTPSSPISRFSKLESTSRDDAGSPEQAGRCSVQSTIPSRYSSTSIQSDEVQLGSAAQSSSEHKSFAIFSSVSLSSADETDSGKLFHRRTFPITPRSTFKFHKSSATPRLLVPTRDTYLRNVANDATSSSDTESEEAGPEAGDSGMSVMSFGRVIQTSARNNMPQRLETITSDKSIDLPDEETDNLTSAKAMQDTNDLLKPVADPNEVLSSDSGIITDRPSPDTNLDIPPTVINIEESSDVPDASPKSSAVTEVVPRTPKTSNVTFAASSTSVEGPYRDLLSFLEQAEKAPHASFQRGDTLDSESVRSDASTHGSDHSPGTLMTGLTHTQLAEEVLALQVLLQEKQRRIELLERGLKHQRELLNRHAKSSEKELKMRLQTQQEEYETTIKRHLKFIDQIIEEKKKIAEKCESLVQEVRSQGLKYEEARKSTEERHQAEIRRIKQSLLTSQKQEKDRWVSEKTNHIKDITARGLEPELRRLMAQHQHELQGLRTLHQTELMRVEQNWSQKSLQQLAGQREQFEMEKESACAKEREHARNKYEKQLEDDEQVHRERCWRLQTELQRERDRFGSEENRYRSELEEANRRSDERVKREKQKLNEAFKMEIENIDKRHQEQLATLRLTLESEKNEVINKFKKIVDEKVLEREKEVIEFKNKENEEELSQRTKKLQEELQKKLAEGEKQLEQQLQRAKERHAAELVASEKQEKDVRDKYCEAKRSLTEKEEELSVLRVSLMQRMKEVEEQKKVLDKYAVERSDVRAALMSEFDMDVLKYEEEKKQLRLEVTRCKSENASRLAKVEVDYQNQLRDKELRLTQQTTDNEKILGDLHNKVKGIVGRKDASLQHMQEKLTAVLQKCQHLEQLLDQQQRDLGSNRRR